MRVVTAKEPGSQTSLVAPYFAIALNPKVRLHLKDLSMCYHSSGATASDCSMSFCPMALSWAATQRQLRLADANPSQTSMTTSDTHSVNPVTDKLASEVSWTSEGGAQVGGQLVATLSTRTGTSSPVTSETPDGHTERR